MKDFFSLHHCVSLKVMTYFWYFNKTHVNHYTNICFSFPSNISLLIRIMHVFLEIKGIFICFSGNLSSRRLFLYTVR